MASLLCVFIDTLFLSMLLFTPFSVTRFAMHRIAVSDVLDIR